MQAIYTHSDRKVELADLSKRVVAFTLDVLLLLSLIGTIDYFTFSSDEQAFFFKPERILDLMLAWIYFAGTEICPSQATLGKYLLGLQVTSTTGKRITFKAATMRFFLKPVSTILVMFRIILGVSPISRRTFHDRLTHSAVVTR